MRASFNPRARVGRDSANLKLAISIIAFQSTRPRGARQREANLLIGKYKFQSTRPRGARPCRQAGTNELLAVSIHAPAWGATASCADSGGGGRCVSIHAPAWGATQAGGDMRAYLCVSIHAPAWGAT